MTKVLKAEYKNPEIQLSLRDQKVKSQLPNMGAGFNINYRLNFIPPLPWEIAT